jgi:hypothetical protein
MHTRNVVLIVALAMFLVPIHEAAAQITTFTYQGRLLSNGVALTGSYDMKLSLFANSSGGGSLASESIAAIPVSNGLFTVQPNFGAAGFPGADRWLEISVSPAGAGTFSLLSPRQQITPTPYAIQSLSAASASSLPWSALTGVPAGFADDVDNDTTYTAGVGLTLGGSQFSANFVGNGTSNSVARSDHTHYDATWTGTALKGISIISTNSGTGGASIYGRRGAGGGINFLSGAGVWGDSSSGSFGVLATAPGTALLAYKTALNGGWAVNGVDDGGSNFSPPGGGGVFGESASGFGVAGFSDTYRGVWGSSQSSVAVYGQSSTGTPLLMNRTAASVGDLAVFQSNLVNKARIDTSGRGFFNGGTQLSGADVAEAFRVRGEPRQYEPGDVLVLSVSDSMCVEKSQGRYSPLVAGVYATKPGLLLTEREIGESLDDTVPMGVVGIIPTKVTGENGAIRIGDLLVTSSIAGHAMKGTDRKRLPGAIIGKALENFASQGTGTIKVLVNVK